MTPDALRATAAQLGMTGNDLADALGVGHRSYWRWLATGRVPHWVEAKIKQIMAAQAAQGGK
jgi:transcriptional regulator with XRE-family HTH domain